MIDEFAILYQIGLQLMEIQTNKIQEKNENKILTL